MTKICRCPYQQFYCRVSLFYFLLCFPDSLHPYSEPSGEDATGQMVHAVWWWRETEVDRGSARCGHCQGCQAHQLCRGIGEISLLYLLAMTGWVLKSLRQCIRFFDTVTKDSTSQYNNWLTVPNTKAPTITNQQVIHEGCILKILVKYAFSKRNKSLSVGLLISKLYYILYSIQDVYIVKQKQSFPFLKLNHGHKTAYFLFCIKQQTSLCMAFVWWLALISIVYPAMWLYFADLDVDD